MYIIIIINNICAALYKQAQQTRSIFFLIYL